jgi:membrane-associated HD superfamily phosphohydrolase
LIKVGEIASKDIVSPIEITVEDVQATEKEKAWLKILFRCLFYNQRIISSVQEKIRQCLPLDGRLRPARRPAPFKSCSLAV